MAGWHAVWREDVGKELGPGWSGGYYCMPCYVIHRPAALAPWAPTELRAVTKARMVCGACGNEAHVVPATYGIEWVVLVFGPLPAGVPA